jgi:hypothetical protein
MITALATVLCLALPGAAPTVGPGRAPAVQMDSLLAAAQRAARAWRNHEFGVLVGDGGLVALSLPRVAATAPLRPAQAAELLRAFAEGAQELEVEVTLARAVDRDLAYVEVQRVFTRRGSRVAATQTIYLGLRREGAGYRVAEVRVVP